MLPIPDLNENGFSKSDALALGNLNNSLFIIFFVCILATFYSITLPNMPYEIVSSVVNLPSDSSYWLNNSDLKNSSNTITTTVTEANKKSFKRKLIDNEENEID